MNLFLNEEIRLSQKNQTDGKLCHFFLLVDNKQNLSNQTAGSETISSI